jgi:hypothetical protein
MRVRSILNRTRLFRSWSYEPLESMPPFIMFALKAFRASSSENPACLACEIELFRISYYSMKKTC